MDKENVVFRYNGVIFSHKETWNPVTSRKMNGTGEHHVKWNKPRDLKTIYVLSHMWKLKKKKVYLNVGWWSLETEKGAGSEGRRWVTWYDQWPQYAYMEMKHWVSLIHSISLLIKIILKWRKKIYKQSLSPNQGKLEFLRYLGMKWHPKFCWGYIILKRRFITCQFYWNQLMIF